MENLAQSTTNIVLMVLILAFVFFILKSKKGPSQ